MSFQKDKLYFDLLKKKHFLNENDREKSFHLLKDSNLPKEDYNHLLNVLSVFKDGRQELFVDADNDYNYSGNERITYGPDFSFKSNMNPDPDILDTLPLIDIRYQVSDNGKIVDLHRKVQIFPYPNYFYLQLYQNEDMKKHGLLLRLKDYWKGTAAVGSTNYHIAAQGLNGSEMKYIIKPDSLLTYKENNGFNSNFRNSEGDTVLLDNNLYRLDDMVFNPPRMFLKKIDSSRKKFTGYKMGYILPNYDFQNLEGKSFSIQDLTNKEYILLDFWGTWCLPCLKLLPDLKKLELDNRDRLNVIGIAFKDSLETLRKFTSDKEVNWAHTYLEKREGIVKDLKISNYPTYILLNKERKIIYTGSGEVGFKAIDSIIRQP